MLCLLLLVRIGKGYEVYENEYAHDILPGLNKRGNFPFEVDGDRSADGFSSVSVLTTTSSSFPLDTSEPKDPIARKEHADEKLLSEKDQGVAGRWDGSYEAEMSAVRRLRDDELGPPPSKLFYVNASLRWNPSAFAIQNGETYTIRVEDTAWLDNYIRVGANGYEAKYDVVSQCYVAAGQCRPSLAGAVPRFPSARWFELVCGIGDFVWKLQQVADATLERYLPLRESELIQTFFSVGTGRSFLANFTGELVCFANDADALYWNNRGSIAINVSRTSWPPIPRTNARSLLADPLYSS